MKRFVRFLCNSGKFIEEVSKVKPDMSTRYFINNLSFNEEGQNKETVEEEVKDAVMKIIDHIDRNTDPNDPALEPNLYVGSAGYAYMFYYLSKQSNFSKYRQSFLYKAETYLTKALDATSKQTSLKDIPGFILGNCGVYAIAAAFYTAVGNHNLGVKYKCNYYNAAGICKEQKFLRKGGDELFVGRAGYIAGALWMAKETKTDIRKTDLHEICNVMVKSGQEYSQKTNSPCPLMYAYYDVEYLGAAHGLAFILQILMSVPGYLDKFPKERELIKESVDYLLSLQDEDGNFPSSTDEIGQTPPQLIHWCHGAPGVIYTMARAYIVFKEEKYLQACKLCAEIIWKKGLLKKGPGICHGIAGNGYAFLLLFRLTNDQQYLRKAMAFARYMESDEFKNNARIPDCPYSLYEGIAGTACFLNDLLIPQTAAFPFSDVF